jgi:hypothetical protein
MSPFLARCPLLGGFVLKNSNRGIKKEFFDTIQKTPFVFFFIKAFQTRERKTRSETII